MIFSPTLKRTYDARQYFRNFVGLTKTLIKHKHDNISFQIKTQNWNYDNQKIQGIAPYHPFLRSRAARASTINFGHVKIVPKFLCIPRTPWVH